jgi:hypothetical protein
LIVVGTALSSSKSKRFTLSALVEFSTIGVGFDEMDPYIFSPASYPALRALHIETGGNKLLPQQVCPFIPGLDTLSFDQLDLYDSEGQAQQIIAPVENSRATPAPRQVPFRGSHWFHLRI